MKKHAFALWLLLASIPASALAADAVVNANTPANTVVDKKDIKDRKKEAKKIGIVKKKKKDADKTENKEKSK